MNLIPINESFDPLDPGMEEFIEVSQPEIRLMTPQERKAIGDYSSWTTLRWEAVRYDAESPAIVIGVIDDVEADIVLTFHTLAGTDDEAINLLHILDDTHDETLWVQGGIDMLEPDETEDDSE